MSHFSKVVFVLALIVQAILAASIWSAYKETRVSLENSDPSYDPARELALNSFTDSGLLNQYESATSSIGWMIMSMCAVGLAGAFIMWMIQLGEDDSWSRFPNGVICIYTLVTLVATGVVGTMVDHKSEAIIEDQKTIASKEWVQERYGLDITVDQSETLFPDEEFRNYSPKVFHDGKEISSKRDDSGRFILVENHGNDEFIELPKKESLK